MNQVFGPQEVEQVRQILDRLYGGAPEATRAAQMEAAICERMRSTRNRSLTQYLTRLEEDAEEQGMLATLLTVGETYFFRTPQHFDAVRSVVLPQFLQEGKSHVRILSAACASGEEPYSLAMLIAEASEQFPWTAEIEAVDVNPQALDKARRAIYTEWSLRGTSAAHRKAFFHPQTKLWELDNRIRQRVRFSMANLMRLHAGQFGYGRDGVDGFDIIFCRNALIYFTPVAIQRTAERLLRMLRPGGYLFLGPTETLRGIKGEYQLCHSHETFYYRKPKTGEEPARESAEMELPDLAWTPDSHHEASMDTAWFDAIQRSATRIEAMTGRSSKSRTAEQVTQITLNDLLALVEQDKMEEALALMERLPATKRSSLPAQLLRAALLTQTGHMAEAMTICREVLESDPLSAEAHYLLSLGLERKNPADARAHAEGAVLLDANFGMAQMRLATLQKQSGEPVIAHNSFRHAITALRKEDRRRLALFGGGFSRAGLVEMCESEARRLEEIIQ